MKYPKMLAFVGLAATALTVFVAAGTASATTLEVEKEKQEKSVAFTITLKAGTSTTFSNTSGGVLNTCTESGTNGETIEPFTGEQVDSFLAEYYFAKCTTPVKVLKLKRFVFDHIEGTTNAEIVAGELEITVSNALGDTVCKTGFGTVIGVVKGVATGQATFEVNAVLNCGFLLPSARWVGTYVFTTPLGLGVIK